MKFLSRHIRLRRHDACDRMRETSPDSGVGLLAAAKTVEPVGQVREIFIGNSHGRRSLVTGQQDVLAETLFVNIVVLFVVALFLGDGPTRAAFATSIKERGLLAHDASVAGR